MFSVFQILAILREFPTTNSVLELARISLQGWVVKFFGQIEKLAVCSVEEESSGTYHAGTVILDIQLPELNCTTAFTVWSGLNSSTRQPEM